MQGFRTRRAFARWQVEASRKHGSRQRAAAALAAMRSQVLRRLFGAWAGCARTAARHTAILLPAFARMRQVTLSSAMAAWRQLAARQARRRLLLSHSLQASHALQSPSIPALHMLIRQTAAVAVQ